VFERCLRSRVETKAEPLALQRAMFEANPSLRGVQSAAIDHAQHAAAAAAHDLGKRVNDMAVTLVGGAIGDVIGVVLGIDPAHHRTRPGARSRHADASRRHGSASSLPIVLSSMCWRRTEERTSGRKTPPANQTGTRPSRPRAVRAWSAATSLAEVTMVRASGWARSAMASRSVDAGTDTDVRSLTPAGEVATWDAT